MNEKELQRISQQAARVGMDAGTTVEVFRRLTEAFRRFPEMPMPTMGLANNSPEVDRDNGELISRREATQTALDFIVEYLGGAFDEGFQKKLMERMNALPSVIPERKTEWVPCSERLPECEQEVLICTKKKVYVNKKTGMEWHEESVITPALYEDGTMLEVNSKWIWEDIDYAEWDEEEDCGIIPEGWWENRHFNPDEVYNNPVDRKVIAWMPLPDPYREEE